MKNPNINKNRMRLAIGRLSLSKTKSVIQTSLIAGTLVALFSFSGQALGQGVPNDPFVILLKGIYEPVVHGPDLGLSQVNLSDGSYSKTNIYRVSGLPGNTHEAVGNFYVRFDFSLRPLCAYQLPGGAMTMEFTSSDYIVVPDGMGGSFLIGTFELTILEGTGIYRSFAGGHNHMVDMLHFLADGRADEYCFCNISRP
jgi:hypothetical protein